MDIISFAAEWFINTVPYGAVVWKVMMFLLVLSVLVFFHELGHYLAARSVGVGVEEFAIGFGRKLTSRRDKYGTEWSIRLWPLGGYVRMYGDDGTEKIPVSRRKEAFLLKNVWQRIWVVFAGPLANFVLAYVFLVGMFSHGERLQSPVVGMVVEDSSAERAGVLVGDEIIEMNGVTIVGWQSMVDQIVASTDGHLDVTLIRADENGNEKQISLHANPVYEDRETAIGEKVHVPFFGVGPKQDSFVIVEHSFTSALKEAAAEVYNITARILEVIGKIVTGSVGADNLGGPIMIADAAGAASEYGWYPLLMLMVVISINLGLINLFPIPVLDGGHLLFFLIEAIKGKPVNEKTQEYGFRFGFAAIGMLMVFVIMNDVNRVWKKISTEETTKIEQPKEPASDE